MFDLVGQAADCNGIPSFALCDHARGRDNAILALSPFPTFPLGDTQSSISQTQKLHLFAIIPMLDDLAMLDYSCLATLGYLSRLE
jgi:hypothetical protein